MSSFTGPVRPRTCLARHSCIASAVRRSSSSGKLSSAVTSRRQGRLRRGDDDEEEGDASEAELLQALNAPFPDVDSYRAASSRSAPLGKGRRSRQLAPASEPDDWGLEGIAERVQAWQTREAQHAGPSASGLDFGSTTSTSARSRRDSVSTSSSDAVGASGTSAAGDVVLSALYARDNPGIVKALQQSGCRVVIDGDSGLQDGDEGEEGDEEGDWEDEVDGADTPWELDAGSPAAVSNIGRQAGGRGAPPLLQGTGNMGRQASSASSSPASSWMQDLEQAGFAVGGLNGGDGVYFERRATPAPAARGVRPAAQQQRSSVASVGAASPPAKASATSGLTPKQSTLPAPGRGVPAAGGATAAAAAASRGVGSSERLSFAEDLGGAASPLVVATAGLASSCSQPRDVLDMLALARPAWAANGFRTVDRDTGARVCDAPSPGEAAHLLAAIATSARRLQLQTVLRSSLARELSVVGLAECLAVTPPRLLTHQDSTMSTSMYAAARRYWLGTAAPRLRGPKAAAGGLRAGVLASSRAASGTAASVAPASSTRPPPASDGTSKATAAAPVDSSYQALVRKYAAAGSSATSAAASAPGASPSSLAAALSAGSAAPEHALLSASARAGAAASGSLAAVDPASLRQASLPAAPRAVSAAAAAVSRVASADAPLQGKQAATVAGIWALSVLGGASLYSSEMDALLQVLVLSPGELSTNAVGQLMWALGNARHWSPLLSDLETRIVQMGGLAVFSPAQATTVLWSFATLAHPAQNLLANIPSSWIKRPKGGRGLAAFSLPQLTSLAWSLAALQQLDTGLLLAVWGELQRRVTVTSKATAVDLAELSRNEVAMMQLWQVVMAVKLEATSWKLPDGTGAGLKGSSWQQLLAKAEKTFMQQTSALRQKVHSNYQRQIANTLRTMRMMHILEDNSTGYSIDVTVPALRIAIEADGPTHAARTNARHQLGATLMKQRHLRAQGWHLISINFTEWDSLAGGGEPARVAHMEKLIQVALQPIN